MVPGFVGCHFGIHISAAVNRAHAHICYRVDSVGIAFLELLERQRPDALRKSVELESVSVIVHSVDVIAEMVEIFPFGIL